DHVGAERDTVEADRPRPLLTHEVDHAPDIPHRLCQAVNGAHQVKGQQRLPTVRVIRRDLCSGRTGRATLNPSSRCSRATLSPGKSMKGNPMQKPCTAMTQGGPVSVACYDSRSGAVR